MTEAHVLFQDIVPYELPSSLEALRGQATGVLKLPLQVWWGPAPAFELDDPAELRAAYRAIVREGRAQDQEALLNRRLLVHVWHNLRLPVRCRQAWEAAFPNLLA